MKRLLTSLCSFSVQGLRVTWLLFNTLHSFLLPVFPFRRQPVRREELKQQSSDSALLFFSLFPFRSCELPLFIYQGCRNTSSFFLTSVFPIMRQPVSGGELMCWKTFASAPLFYSSEAVNYLLTLTNVSYTSHSFLPLQLPMKRQKSRPSTPHLPSYLLCSPMKGQTAARGV